MTALTILIGASAILAGENSTLDVPEHEEPTASPASFVVTTTLDSGEGSLRQAILDAGEIEGPVSITFDHEVFAEPQVIELQRALPDLVGELTIDGFIEGRLWQSSGVTIRGGAERPRHHHGAD